MYIIATNKRTGCIVSSKCKVANNFFTRLKGLQFEKSFSKKDGLLLIPCNQIHCFFMFMNIDVLFIDKDGIIIDIKENMKPWRVSKFYKDVEYVLELPNGAISNIDIVVGDILDIKKIISEKT